MEETVVSLQQRQDFQFDVHFEGIPTAPLLADEDPPVGQGAGPSPTHFLAAAVANCLSASLLFAMRKYKNHPEPIQTSARLHTKRNEAGRIRVGSIDVEMRIGQVAQEIQQLERILAQFEDFCTVTQSVRTSIDVNVRVFDSTGTQVYDSTAP